jgi:hypothetical protein
MGGSVSTRNLLATLVDIGDLSDVAAALQNQQRF